MSLNVVTQFANGNTVSADNMNVFAQAVDSIANLRSSSVPTAEMCVYVRGIGGAPSGVFYWNSSSSAADNSATVILPTGYGGTGRWVQLTAGMSGDLTVWQCGADPTGSADSSEAFSLMDGLGGGLVPPGTYKIAINTTLTNGVRLLPAAKIQPASGKTMTFNGSFAAEPMLQCFDASAGGSIAGTGFSEVWVTWFGALPNGTDYTAKVLAAIALAKTAQCPFRVSGTYTVSTTLPFELGMTVIGSGVAVLATNSGTNSPISGFKSTANPIASCDPYPGTIIEGINLIGSGSDEANIATWDQPNYTGQIGWWVGTPFSEGISATGTGGTMSATGSSGSKTLTSLGTVANVSVGQGVTGTNIAPGTCVTVVSGTSCTLNNYPTGTVTSATFYGGDTYGQTGGGNLHMRNCSVQDCTGWGFYGYRFWGISSVSNLAIVSCGYSSTWSAYRGGMCFTEECVDLDIIDVHVTGLCNVSFKVGAAKSDTDALNRLYNGPGTISLRRCFAEGGHTTASVETALMVQFCQELWCDQCEFSGSSNYGKIIIGEPALVAPNNVTVTFRDCSLYNVTDLYLGSANFTWEDTVAQTALTIHYQYLMTLRGFTLNTGFASNVTLSPNQLTTGFTDSNNAGDAPPVADVSDNFFTAKSAYDIGATLANYGVAGWTASGGSQSKTSNDEYAQSGTGSAATLYLDITGLKPSTLYSVGFGWVCANTDAGSNHSAYIGKPSTAQTQIAKSANFSLGTSGTYYTLILQGYTDASGDLRVGYTALNGSAGWYCLRPVIQQGPWASMLGTFSVYGHTLQFNWGNQTPLVI